MKIISPNQIASRNLKWSLLLIMVIVVAFVLLVQTKLINIKGIFTHPYRKQVNPIKFTTSITFTAELYEKGCLKVNANLCPHNGKNRVLIVVCSAPKNIQARMAIRRTWGQYAVRKGILVAYLIGSFSNKRLEEKIDSEENVAYGDIIKGKFLDSYNNLTLKSISMLEYVHLYCSDVNFIVKVDDDSFINVDVLFNYIKNLNPQNRTIYGNVQTNAKPFRNIFAKYYMSKKEYFKKIYPNYATGQAYIIPGILVTELISSALELPYFRFEDVFLTGIVAKMLGINVVGDPIFWNKEWERNLKVSNYICIHRASPKEQFDFWRATSIEYIAKY